MTWPNGVTEGIGAAIELMYRRYDLMQSSDWASIKEIFKTLVSDWCVANPGQVNKEMTEADISRWADHLYRHFWADAESEHERGLRIIGEEEEPEPFYRPTPHRKRNWGVWEVLMVLGIVVFVTPFVIIIATIALYVVLYVIQYLMFSL